MPTDTREKGLENIIENYLLDVHHYEKLVSDDYNKDYALCTEVIEQYLVKTQPQKVANTMCFNSPSEKHKFFTRLSEAITKNGVTHILRKGFNYIGETFELYAPLPSELNQSAQWDYVQNRFAIMRQLHYSKSNPELSIDMAIFINGLPLLTMELKNHYTNQTIKNAESQYQTDRDCKDLLFMPKRCAVHFAVDDTDVSMCTWLAGKDSWFLPFNKGVNGGAGNPVNPNGLMTAYLWEDIFEKHSLSDIIENYAQVTVEEKRDKKTGKIKKKEKNIWPRYHQLMCVRALLADSKANPLGRRYLIQHSAGSGKSNSITWLAYQCVDLMIGTSPVFDSVIVVTDRVNLDKQIRDNINSFKHIQGLIGWAVDSQTLKDRLKDGTKIIITIIHKFPYILDTIGKEMKNKHFAIIIDEAHSSQNGSMSAMMNIALSSNIEEEEDDIEERINKIIEGRKMLKNANYYAFTATPKNKTLEMFGTPMSTIGDDGMECTSFYPFHEYTMKQAIEEGFIMDVLKNYTPYSSYYKIMKTAEDDPQYDKKQASKKLRAYVESQPETIEEKSRVIVNHFCEKVATKIGGKARAMVVTSSIERAIEFYFEITRQLEERHSPFKAIVAFSGEKDYHGKTLNESKINDFPSSQIEERMEEEPYRILVVANKFQTGYDQPLLHTMYVDKILTSVKAVQTLSRLNRCHPKKHDTFVLDFANDPDEIRAAFQTYYKTTILSHETDPNKLNDLIDEIENCHIYTQNDIDKVCEMYFGGESREKIDPIIDGNSMCFRQSLDEDQQIKCKAAMRSFIRLYPFIAAVIPQKSVRWEKIYTFYCLLFEKLPTLKGEDWAKDIIEKIDFDKYRLIKEEERSITLENKDEAIGPVPVSSFGGVKNPDFANLSNIIDDFNTLYGNIDWQHPEKVKEQINQLPGLLQQEDDFINATKNAGRNDAELVSSGLLTQIIANMLAENTEFAKNYFENPEFMAFINNRVFTQAYNNISKQ